MPTAPVNWTFQLSADSKAQNIVTAGLVAGDYTKRFGMLDTSLVLYKVQLSDDGLFNCCDANGAVIAYNVTILGKEVSHFTILLSLGPFKVTGNSATR